MTDTAHAARARRLATLLEAAQLLDLDAGDVRAVADLLDVDEGLDEALRRAIAVVLAVVEIDGLEPGESLREAVADLPAPTAQVFLEAAELAGWPPDEGTR